MYHSIYVTNGMTTFCVCALSTASRKKYGKIHVRACASLHTTPMHCQLREAIFKGPPGDDSAFKINPQRLSRRAWTLLTCHT